jgi:hypothetical protein
MAVAIPLTEYKKSGKLTGYKIPKRKFAQELENDIPYNFVLLCDGDPAIAKRLIYSKHKLKSSEELWWYTSRNWKLYRMVRAPGTMAQKSFFFFTFKCD